MLDKNLIPKGDYCYTIDKILWDIDPTVMPSIKTKLCPYWKFMDIRTQEPYCSFCDMEKIEYDTLLLGDQCKVCGINIGDEEWQE
jgi:hypothetical protein